MPYARKLEGGTLRHTGLSKKHPNIGLVMSMIHDAKKYLYEDMLDIDYGEGGVVNKNKEHRYQVRCHE